jgi:hypothetical protein
MISFLASRLAAEVDVRKVNEQDRSIGFEM